MRWLRQASAALVVVGVAGGCVFGLPKGPEANETDAERLAIVQQDPLLRNARVITEAGPDQTSANVLTRRWLLSEHMGVQASDAEPATAMWKLSQGYVDEALASGWKITAANCLTTGSIWILALRDYGTFTAALVMNTGQISHDLRVIVPFHTEPANPWDPGVPLAEGSTCAERDQPPVADQGAVLKGYNYDTALGYKIES